MSSEVEAVLNRYPDARPNMLIPILQEVQKAEGFLSQETMNNIGRHLALPTSQVYGVATFYNQFRFKPLGKHHIIVCRGTACHVRGSAEVLRAFKDELAVEPGNTTEDGLFSLEVVACIGSCGLAPVINVNGEFHAGMTPAKVQTFLNRYRPKEKKEND